MDSFYRQMWEEAAYLPSDNRETQVEKKYFNKIILTKNHFPETDFLYYTMEIKEDLFNNDALKERVVKELCALLEVYFKKYGIKKKSTVLVAGLGNEKVTADSLGCEVTNRLYVTSHLYAERNIMSRFGNLMCCKCGVSGTTGIASFDVLSAIANRVKPDIIIAVDTLACNATARLAHTIQITDSGIEPGGGVNNAKTKLTSSSLGVPVLAIGVPLVVYVKKILTEYLSDTVIDIDKTLAELVVTAKEIDFQISDFSHVIAESLNRTVHRAQE